MSASDMIVDALEVKGITQKDLAARLGQNYKTLARRISDNRMTAQQFIDIAHSIGFVVALELLEGNGSEEKATKLLSSDEPISFVRGTGPRVKHMVDGVAYDTAKSDAICHTPLADGRYMELYRDQDGRYFIVHYSLWHKEDHSISACSEDEARHLVEKYG